MLKIVIIKYTFMKRVTCIDGRDCKQSNLKRALYDLVNCPLKGNVGMELYNVF